METEGSYCVYKILSLDLTLSQMNTPLTSYLFNIYLNIILLSTSRSPRWSPSLTVGPRLIGCPRLLIQHIRSFTSVSDVNRSELAENRV